jgi:hypothetical protein
VGPDLQELVDEVSRLLGSPATLEDRSFHLVAYGSQPARVDAVRRTSILQRESPAAVRRWFEQFGIADSEEPVRTPGAPELGVLPRLCLPARFGGMTYGYLWLLDEGSDGRPEDLALARDLAARAGWLLARAAREQQSREDRLADLLGDDRVAAEQAAADLLDAGLLRAGTRVAVAALRPAAEDARPADPEGRGVPLRPGVLPGGVLAGPLRGHTVLLVPLREAGLQSARDAVAQLLDDAPGTVAGIGAERRDLMTVHAGWAEARVAARVAAAVPGRGPVAEWEQLGAYRLLGTAPDAALAATVLDSGILRLLDDADDRLATTAARWLELAGSVKDTAASLQVHRQTLYYRLQRIEQVTGLDLTRGEDRLRLHLGLLLGPLVRPAPG